MDSLASQPASAMYPRASAASDALNVVLAPISRALASNASSSSPVAPDRAATLLMEYSNFWPVSTIWRAISAMLKPATIPPMAANATENFPLSLSRRPPDFSVPSLIPDSTPLPAFAPTCCACAWIPSSLRPTPISTFPSLIHRLRSSRSTSSRRSCGPPPWPAPRRSQGASTPPAARPWPSRTSLSFCAMSCAR